MPSAKKTAKAGALEMIQTLHPDKAKTNKRISLEKYEFIKKHLLAVLKKTELTHTDLMEALYQRVKDDFEGGVQWYGETVKLDLEARGVLERTGKNPAKYKIKSILWVLFSLPVLLFVQVIPDTCSCPQRIFSQPLINPLFRGLFPHSYIYKFVV